MHLPKSHIEPLDISLVEARAQLYRRDPSLCDKRFLQLCQTIRVRLEECESLFPETSTGQALARLRNKNYIQGVINFLNYLLSENGSYHQKGNSSFQLFMLKGRLEDMLKNRPL